jgi:hypothetical protein
MSLLQQCLETGVRPIPIELEEPRFDRSGNLRAQLLNQVAVLLPHGIVISFERECEIVHDPSPGSGFATGSDGVVRDGLGHASHVLPSQVPAQEQQGLVDHIHHSQLSGAHGG